MSYLGQLNGIESNLTDKEVKRYQLDSMKRLDVFLVGKVDESVLDEFGRIVSELSLVNDKATGNMYLKNLRVFKDKLVKNYDYYEKGALQSKYSGLGIAIGSGIGVALSSSNPAFLSVGIGCGIAIGAGIGSNKEKEATEAGRVY